MKIFTLLAGFFLFSVSPSFAQMGGKDIYDVGALELETSPMPENKKELDAWLYKHKKLSIDKKDSKVKTKVTLVLTVDEKGKVVKPSIRKGLGPAYDAEALRLFREQPYSFVPAMKDGQPVKAQKYYIIDFAKGK